MENNFIRSLDHRDDSSMSVQKFIIILLLIALVGGAIGFVFSSFRGTSKSIGIGGGTVKKTAGIVDKKTFKDQAEGILREGGIDGEGNFHLERQGGQSQNAYLTSSTVDLSQYIGKKVRVWGQTFKGEKAGWLMDVGLVEIL
jgi:hypothetical protein